MEIQKILMVPADALVDESASSRFSSVLRPLKEVKRYFNPGATPYDAEILFYSDIPLVLGSENVFQFGEYPSQLHFKRVPSNSPYPSCHGTPRATIVRHDEIADILEKVDALLVSTRAGTRRDVVVPLARKKGIPVALLDFQDHHANYGAADIRKELTYGFRRGRDYDLYFKKDLPLGYATDCIRPLAPVPVRPESFAIPEMGKDVDVFYSGRSRAGCQADRGETVELVKENFHNTLIKEHAQGRGSFMTTHEYWRSIARSKMALSPSGKVWDSLRHCEVGLARGTALIAPRPYVETVGPKFEDGKNSILYDTKFREGKYHLKNPSELVGKIKHFLSDDASREALASAWVKDVREGHTVFARSRYLVEEMGRVFS